MSDFTTVLDASALLALLNSEPGAEMVAAALPGAGISAVNLSEVVAKLAEHGMSEGAIRSALDGLGLEVVEWDVDQAYQGGMLRPSTKASSLSFGDRACLTLGLLRDLPVLTADRGWLGMEIEVDIRVIR